MEPVNIIKIIVDLLIFIITLIGWIIVTYCTKARKIGFYCNDYTIGLEYKDSTITNLLLIFISTLMPILFILITEFINSFKKQHFKYKIIIFNNKRMIEIPNMFTNIYIHLGTYLFGLCFVLFITNLAKYSLGRLRPHFMDICKPVDVLSSQLITIHDCSFKHYYKYDIDFKCSGLNEYRINEASLSFPSGHASIAFYTCLFLSIYIHHRWKCLEHSLLVPFIQLLLLIIAIYTSISRVFDNKHHVTDVLAGSLLGILLAIFAYYRLIKKWINNLNKFINYQQQKPFDNNNNDIILNQINQQQQQQQQQYASKTSNIYADNVV